MEKLDIKPLDEQVMEETRRQVDALVKPLGSLGELEEYAVQLAGIRRHMGGELGKTAVLVFAADNGVHAEDVSPVPQRVTRVMAENMLDGVTGVNVFARQAGAEVRVYNVGIAEPVSKNGMRGTPIMRGTHNMAKGPAMSGGQCEAALNMGYEAAMELSDYGAVGIGEMGICNTSTTAAVAAVLTGRPVHTMVGHGAGITDEQYRNKIDVIERAIDLNRPDEQDPVDVLTKVGGLDLAAMTGAYLGCAAAGVPVVIDGFISAAAALCAVRIEGVSKEYMFASHKSFEPGYAQVLRALGMKPAFDLEMRLGEGSGTPFMFYLLDGALRMLEEMGTFDESDVDRDDYVDIREL